MYWPGAQDLGYFNTTSFVPIASPKAQEPWKIQIYHRDGGLKKSWRLNQFDNPINDITYEKNLNGCGAGTLNFSYLNFTIDPMDYVLILYNNKIDYRGIFQTGCDPKGGQVLLASPKTVYDAALWYPAVYNNASMMTILKDVITNLTTQTGVIWNPGVVDLGNEATSGNVYNISYTNDKLTDALDIWVNKLTGGRYWGIDQYNQFFIKKPSTIVTKVLTSGSKKMFSTVEKTVDNSKIQFTALKLYTKPQNGGSDSVFVDAVGYNNTVYGNGPGVTYPDGWNPLCPPVPLETIVGKKEQNYTFGKYIDPYNQVLIGYLMCLAQAPAITYKVYGIDISQYFPQIGDLDTVEDQDELINSIIVNCDSITGWTGATLSTTDYCEGSGSVYFSASSPGAVMSYDFGADQRYLKPKNINFMLKSVYAGNFLTIKIEATDGTSLTQIISIQSGGQWNNYEIPYTRFIRKISFIFTGTPAAVCQVNVDRVQIYAYNKNSYTDNVVQANYHLTPSGEDVSMILNEYQPKANDYLFDVANNLGIEITKNKG
jgi:hypothetical protein